MAVTKPFFVIPLDLGTMATGNETAGYAAVNLKRNKAIGLTWKSTGASNVWVRGDFGAAQSIDFCSMISANALVGTKYRLKLGSSQAAVDGGGVDISNSANTTVAQQSGGIWRVTKSGGVNGTADASAVSAASFAGDFVLMVKPQQITGTGYMGVNADPATNNSNVGLDVAMTIAATTVTATLNGVNGSSTTITAADYLFIVRSGTTVTLRKGSSDDYTAATTFQTYTSISTTLFFDSSIATAGNIYDVRYSSATIPTYDSGYQTFINPAITRLDALYHSHLELPSVVSAQWWRLEISGHTGDFQASSLVLGQKVQPGRFYNWDFAYGVKDLGDLNIGRFGVFDEEPGIMFRTIDFTLAWTTEAEFETSFRPMFESLGRRGIVYCCFDPTANAYRQARSYLGTFDKVPYSKGVRKPATFSQDFAIVSMI